MADMAIGLVLDVQKLGRKRLFELLPHDIRDRHASPR
jgi:hypothetical protein